MSAEKLLLHDNRLRDFIAEKLLERGAAVSFAEKEKLELLFAGQDDGEQIYLFVSAEDFREKVFGICELLKNYPAHEMVIPVLKQEEERYFKKILQRWKNDRIRTYRLSLLERYSLQIRPFCEILDVSIEK